MFPSIKSLEMLVIEWRSIFSHETEDHWLLVIRNTLRRSLPGMFKTFYLGKQTGILQQMTKVAFPVLGLKGLKVAFILKNVRQGDKLPFVCTFFIFTLSLRPTLLGCREGFHGVAWRRCLCFAG